MNLKDAIKITGKTYVDLLNDLKVIKKEISNNLVVSFFDNGSYAVNEEGLNFFYFHGN